MTTAIRIDPKPTDPIVIRGYDLRALAKLLKKRWAVMTLKRDRGKTFEELWATHNVWVHEDLRELAEHGSRSRRSRLDRAPLSESAVKRRLLALCVKHNIRIVTFRRTP